MRALIVSAVAALFAGGAAPVAGVVAPATTTQCLEVGGQLVPSVCQNPASRLDQREYICTCPNGGEQVKVPVCSSGDHPPPESKALNNVRREAGRDGTLVGDQFEGRPICVKKPNP